MLRVNGNIKQRNVFKGFHGCVRCPACGCVGSSQAAIDRHILRKRDDEHFKLRDISARRLNVREPV